MARYTKQDVMRMVDEEDVSFIRLQFTDIFGMVKNIAITSAQLERALNNECSFDGSGIDGFVRIEEEDMYLYPDLDTFEIFPWRPQTAKVARMICDIYTKDGKPFGGDSRHVLKTVTKAAAREGYFLYIAPECEFCVFPLDSEGEVSMETRGRASYFDVAPLDTGENVRRDIILNLEDMGIPVASSYHEHSPYQHEIDLMPVSTLRAADNIVTFRLTAKTIAPRHGLYATFMPKPKNDSDGCGMHLVLQLCDIEGNNVFYDAQDSYHLSEIGYSFMAGIMAHINGLTAVTNPLVNSYKRMAPGTGNEAPSYVVWSGGNRSPLISVTSSRKEGSTVIELRNPDPSMNPYLSIAGILAAGMDGIHKKMRPMPPTERNIIDMSNEERRALGLQRLPENLEQAVGWLMRDELLLDTFGEQITQKYVRAKKSEVEEYMAHVTDWEVDQYMHKF